MLMVAIKKRGKQRQCRKKGRRITGTMFNGVGSSARVKGLAQRSPKAQTGRQRTQMLVSRPALHQAGQSQPRDFLFCSPQYTA